MFIFYVISRFETQIKLLCEMEEKTFLPLLDPALIVESSSSGGDKDGES